MRLQRERPIEEGDIWRLLCLADPDRALRVLRLEGVGGNWNLEAWQSFLWEASEKATAELQFELADLLLEMPDAPLGELLSSAASWLRRRRETFMNKSPPDGVQFFRLWDRSAKLTYEKGEDGELGDADDLLTRALNEPGGDSRVGPSGQPHCCRAEGG